MKTISMASQVSPENSIHRVQHISSSTSTTTSAGSAIVTRCSTTIIDQQQQSSLPKERQCSGGTKRFFVSRVQYPIGEDDRGGYGSNTNDEIQYSPTEQLLEAPRFIQPSVETIKLEELTDNDGAEKAQLDEEITFRYTWPVRITERLIGADESAILNVSPPFCTACNGVQFTWMLRICEDDILDFGGESEGDESADSSSGFFADGGDESEQQQQLRGKKVNITLYYKEGPARDVKLHGGNISIRNSDGGVLFENMPLRDLEYTKGGGWSPICDDAQSVNARFTEEQHKFSEFIHDHIGKQITVRVQLNMPASMFQPMQYLPSIESPKLETLCARVLDEIRLNQLQVPDVQYFDLNIDKYALYRHVFQFACQEIFCRFMKEHENYGDFSDEQELMGKIRNIFAHFYFNTVIVREAEYFEDFLEALDASRHVQFPALRRECERYICTEVMTESADLALVKKMLLLAERFNLSVLKMVSFGVIVDRLLLQQPEPSALVKLRGGKHRTNKAHSSCATIDSMEEIREELLEIAEQIIHPVDHHNHSSTSSLSQQSVNAPGTNNNMFLQCPKVHRKHSKSLPSARNSDSSAEDGDDEKSADDVDASSSEDEADSDAGGETLVGSVITQLEELARHIRKVSMPPGVSPAPNGRPTSPELTQNQNSPGLISIDSGAGSMDSRRSSLKTSRVEFLQHNCAERSRGGQPLSASAHCSGLPYPNGHRGSNSFFTQIYRQRQGSSSSTDCVPTQQQPQPIRDRAYSSQIDNIASSAGLKEVKFLNSLASAANCRRKGSSNNSISRPAGSNSNSKLFGVRFEPAGGRHREADEDEGVDVEEEVDQQE